MPAGLGRGRRERHDRRTRGAARDHRDGAGVQPRALPRRAGALRLRGVRAGPGDDRHLRESERRLRRGGERQERHRDRGPALQPGDALGRSRRPAPQPGTRLGMRRGRRALRKRRSLNALPRLEQPARDAAVDAPDLLRGRPLPANPSAPRWKPTRGRNRAYVKPPPYAVVGSAGRTARLHGTAPRCRSNRDRRRAGNGADPACIRAAPRRG